MFANHADVAPSDTEIQHFHLLYIAGAGNIRLADSNGAEVTRPVAAGEKILLSGTKIFATNTTATGIVRYW